LHREQAREIGPAQLKMAQIIANGVRLHEPIQRRERRIEQPMRVLYAGRITREKGALLCVDAVAELVGRGKPIQLTMAGNGPDEAELQRKIAESGLQQYVRRLGLIAPDRVRTLLAESDLLWSPSIGSEGLPYSIIEALEAGVPVCSTLASAAIEDLVRSSDGAVVAVEPSSESLAARTEELIDDPRMHLRACLTARRFTENHLSVLALVPYWKRAWQLCPQD
jgi:glycosyltransferase involved in cell wall biosynthesis